MSFLPPRAKRRLSAIALILASFLVLVSAFNALGYQFDWSALWRYRLQLLNGYWETLKISSASFVLSLMIGVLLAMARKSRWMVLQQISTGFVVLLRGTPLLVQILVWYYVVFNTVGLDNAFLAGVLILSLFSGAYMSEIFRGGIESIEPMQIEAASSLCFTPFQTYWHIIIPQVFVRVVPAMTGQLSSLIKDSSLLSVIAVAELTRASQEVSAYSFTTFEIYFASAVAYLSLTLPIMGLGRYLEKRFYY